MALDRKSCFRKVKDEMFLLMICQMNKKNHQNLLHGH